MKIAIVILSFASCLAYADIGPQADVEGGLVSPGMGADPQSYSCSGCNAKVTGGQAFTNPDGYLRVTDDVLNTPKTIPASGSGDAVSMTDK